MSNEATRVVRQLSSCAEPEAEGQSRPDAAGQDERNMEIPAFLSLYRAFPRRVQFVYYHSCFYGGRPQLYVFQLDRIPEMGRVDELPKLIFAGRHFPAACHTELLQVCIVRRPDRIRPGLRPGLADRPASGHPPRLVRACDVRAIPDGRDRHGRRMAGHVYGGPHRIYQQLPFEMGFDRPAHAFNDR